MGHEAKLDLAALKLLRFAIGAKRIDRIRDEYIRKTMHVERQESEKVQR